MGPLSISKSPDPKVKKKVTDYRLHVVHHPVFNDWTDELEVERASESLQATEPSRWVAPRPVQ